MQEQLNTTEMTDRVRDLPFPLKPSPPVRSPWNNWKGLESTPATSRSSRKAASTPSKQYAPFQPPLILGRNGNHEETHRSEGNQRGESHQDPTERHEARSYGIHFRTSPQSLLINRPPNTTRSAKTSSTSPRGAKNSTPFWVVAKQTPTITTRWNGNGIAN